MPSTRSIVMISPLGGAVARVGEDATAVGHRRAAVSLSVDSVWTEPAEAGPNIGWTDRIWSALRPHCRGAYVNELGDEGPGRVREAYTAAAWERLRAIKQRYDPDNVFRLNQNIPPAGDDRSRKR
jgi:FAD/FMN-containing dehydrogenase